MKKRFTSSFSSSTHPSSVSLWTHVGGMSRVVVGMNDVASETKGQTFWNLLSYQFKFLFFMQSKRILCCCPEKLWLLKTFVPVLFFVLQVFFFFCLIFWGMYNQPYYKTTEDSVFISLYFTIIPFSLIILLVFVQQNLGIK